MKNLVESILNNDLVSANDIFESRLEEIMESKLYEAKRRVAADMNEALGGLSLAQIQARKELGWKKASDVYPDPRDRVSSTTFGKTTQKKKVVVKKKIKEEVSRSEVEKEKKELMKKGKAYPSYGKAVNLDLAKKVADRQKQAAAAVDEPESKLKKLGTSVSGIMKNAEKQDRTQRLANIAARQQRLAARGHSDPGAHLRHAQIASATRKVVKPFKDTLDVVRGKQTDKTGTLGKVAGYLLTKDISG